MNSISSIKKAWRIGLIIQYSLLLVFLITSSVFGADYKIMHIIIFYLIIGTFVFMMGIALMVAIKMKRSILFALFILILCNGFGSLFLYFIYRKDMDDKKEQKSI